MPKLVVFLSMLLFSSLLYAEESEIYHFLSGEFAPYTGEHLKNGGLASEIVEAAITGMGAKLNITYLPWRRGHLLAKQGKYFAIYPYSSSDERRKHWRYSAPLYELEEHIFVKKENAFNYQDKEDLRGKSICRPKGYNLFGLEKLRDEGTLTIEQPPELKACFLMLNIGRVDAVITNPKTAWSILENIDLTSDQVKQLDTPFLLNTHYLIVSKKIEGGAEFIKAFNRQLETLKQSGQINAILNPKR